MGKRGDSRQRVYHYVRDRILAGNPPTVREVQEALGFGAVESAREHLEALVSQGFLEKLGRQSRGYRLPGYQSRPSIPVPLLGRVQAGALTTAVEDLEGYIPVNPRADEDELFALRVQGESMRDAGILPGDVVVVRRQADAPRGSIVVALVDDEATVKQLFVSGDQVELRPHNPAFSPIVVSASELVLLGKVIEVRRYIEPPAFLSVP